MIMFFFIEYNWHDEFCVWKYKLMFTFFFLVDLFPCVHGGNCLSYVDYKLNRVVI